MTITFKEAWDQVKRFLTKPTEEMLFHYSAEMLDSEGVHIGYTEGLIGLMKPIALEDYDKIRAAIKQRILSPDTDDIYITSFCKVS